jgi:hypothetical protein
LKAVIRFARFSYAAALAMPPTTAMKFHHKVYFAFSVIDQFPTSIPKQRFRR